MLPVIKPFVEGGVKYSILCLCAYYVFFRTLPQSPGKRRGLIGALPVILLGVSMQFLKPLLGPWMIIYLITVLTLHHGLFFRCKPGRTVTLSITGFCLCYGIFLLVGFLSSFLMYWYNVILTPSEMWRMDLKTENWLNVAVFLFLEGLVATAVYCLLQSNRIKIGLVHIGNFGEKDAGLYLSLMLILTATAFIYYSQKDASSVFSTATMLLTFFFFFSLIFWIRYEIHAVSLTRQRETDFSRMEDDLRIAEQEITILRQDNERLAAVIHRDNKLIPAMVTSARQCVSSAAFPINENISASSAEMLLETARKLEEIYAQRMAAVEQYECHDHPLEKTGLVALDAILSYMQRRACAQNIRFSLTADPHLPELMEQSSVDRRHFGTMLADLTENALIAVQSGSGSVKEVSVAIGRDPQEHLFLAVSDSGVPFAPDVLKLMGKRKITTHRDTGGSGIGLMTLFALLKEYRASFCLENYTDRDGGDSFHGDFTKRVTVTFDGTGKTVIVPSSACE